MSTSQNQRPLDVYDLAVLAGGLPRLVDTVVVALVESGRIRVHSPGELSAAVPSRRHPVEAAVLDAVGTRGHRSVDTICWRLVGDQRLAQVVEQLRADGLLRRTIPSRLIPGRPAHTLTAAGRRTVRQLTDRPPINPVADGGSAVLVAVHGRDAMPDARLRAEIFERPPTALAPGRPGRRSRSVDHSDPALSAYRTGGAAAAAGAFLLIDGSGLSGGGL
jgi:hypothetical protein